MQIFRHTFTCTSDEMKKKKNTHTHGAAKHLNSAHENGHIDVITDVGSNAF